MNKSSEKSHVIEFLFPIILFFVFALSALAVILLAGNSYRNTVETSARNFSSKTALTYIDEKIHQSDVAGSISLGKRGDTPALVLKHQGEMKDFSTYIYMEEGQIKELLVRNDVDPQISSGTAIIEVSDFTMEELKEGLYLFSCTDTDGESNQIIVSARSH